MNLVKEKKMRPLNDKGWDEIGVGDVVPPLKKKIVQEIINKYATASEDPNPLHFDPEFAKKTPFKGTIAHGTMYLAYVSQMLMQWFPNRWITGGQMEMSFLAPARPGDTLSVQGKVLEKREKEREIVFEVSCENQEGKKIIAGTARVIWEYL
jgi:3-hydroxybutyryl-CoA dehydratase